MLEEMKYPVYEPYMAGSEEAYVVDALRSGWISSRGKYLSLFEDAFANYLGVKHATAVSNGTTALHLALMALDISPGDEVIVPTFTYVATANAISYVGATAVFCDSEPRSWNIDVEQVRSLITARTKAILAVHIYGAMCDMKALLQLCKDNDIFLIEDTAEALGSELYGLKAGSFGDIATFSFYGNKTITTGEGGMVVAKSDCHFDRIVSLKNQAMCKSRRYWHEEVGFNYRMTNICAAIGLAQLSQLDEILEKKASIAAWYAQELKDCPVIFQDLSPGVRSSYWMVSILLESEADRDKLVAGLASAGVETRPLFFPVHTMPMYERNSSFPVAEHISRIGINLPSYPGLSKPDVREISAEIKQLITGR